MFNQFNQVITFNYWKKEKTIFNQKTFSSIRNQTNQPVPADDSNKDVKPFKFSPFQVPFKENKVDYALARVDDLLNFGRRVI